MLGADWRSGCTTKTDRIVVHNSATHLALTPLYSAKIAKRRIQSFAIKSGRLWIHLHSPEPARCFAMYGPLVGLPS